ncbi:MAG: site-specific integrase [Butyrivibrio sp.]|nr:site-specific integrase [Butyrivibrio sp.]
MATVNLYKGKSKTSYQLTLYKGYKIGKNGQRVQNKETVTYTLEKMGISAVTYAGKPRSESAILKEVQLYADNLEKNCARTNYTKGDKTRFADFYEHRWKAWAEDNLSDSSYYIYSSSIEKNIIPALGMLKLSDITEELLYDFYVDIVKTGNDKKGFSRNTILGINRQISSVMQLAKRNKIVQENPCRGIEIPKKCNDPEEKVKYFTKEQADVFLEILDNPPSHVVKAFYADSHSTRVRVLDFCSREDSLMQYDTISCLLRVALFSGCRVGELCALTWNDIDFESCTISISKSLAYAKNKGGLYIKEPKTKNSSRKVVIPQTEMERLIALKKKQRERMMRLGSAWKGYTDKKDFDRNLVFSCIDGNYLWRAQINYFMQRIISNYNEHVAEDERLPVLTVHCLRHTSATLLIAGNLDAKTVSSRLGHKDVQTTLDIYAHPLDERDRLASAILEEMLVGKKA